MVREQIDVLLKDFGVRAIRARPALLGGDCLRCCAGDSRRQKKTSRPVPLVVDPVMIATSSNNLFGPGAVEATKTNCFRSRRLSRRISTKRLTLRTTIEKPRNNGERAEELSRRRSRAWILLKGGHLRGDDADHYFHYGELTEFSAPFVRGVEARGTGCACSAARTTVWRPVSR